MNDRFHHLQAQQIKIWVNMQFGTSSYNFNFIKRPQIGLICTSLSIVQTMIVDGQWIFERYERDTKLIFLELVKNRTQEMLLEIIHRRIKPGTNIISDCWRAYNCLSHEGKHTVVSILVNTFVIQQITNIILIGYKHLTVTHQVNFVDPDTGANTQSIERTWRSVNTIVPTSGRNEAHMAGYLADYQYPRIHSNETTVFTTFSCTWNNSPKQISPTYPQVLNTFTIVTYTPANHCTKVYPTSVPLVGLQ